eukprot:GHVN01013545.1.p1 GENE.GHVN01013545.1~~GHVN01013545.1.p1  ORF type:complete len:723 (+),score=105.88 GHVN01013545.1:1947-4115(+)
MTGSEKNGKQTPKRRNVIVQLHSTTWASDSHGLFDYESSSVYKRAFKCLGLVDVYYAVRSGTDVNLVGANELQELLEAEANSKIMAVLVWNASAGAYYLNPAPPPDVREAGVPNPETGGLALPFGQGWTPHSAATPQPPTNPHVPESARSAPGGVGGDRNAHSRGPVAATTGERLWLIVKSLKDDPGARLSEGDMVKLGRYKLKVKEVVTNRQDLLGVANRYLSASVVDDDAETVAPEPEVPLQSESSQRVGPGVLESVSGPDEEPTDPVDPVGPVPIASADEDGARSPALPTPTAGREPEAVDNIIRSSSSLGGPACRICLCEGGEANNPMVSPCKCKGSMRHVHLQCLRTWMAGRLNIRNDGSTVGFFWRNLECELCKAPYPTFITIEEPEIGSDGNPIGNYRALPAVPVQQLSSDAVAPARARSMSARLTASHLTNTARHSNGGSPPRTIELFEIPRPELPYIILEPRQSQQARGLHVVSLAGRKSAQLGRGHESDIRLSDISVSRSHARLKFVHTRDGHYFYLEDDNAKFGTLIELKTPFKLESGPGVSIQVGRSVLQVSVKRQWSLTPFGCFKGSSRSDITYTEVRNPLAVSASAVAAMGQGEPPSPQPMASPPPVGNLQHQMVPDGGTPLTSRQRYHPDARAALAAAANESVGGDNIANSLSPQLARGETAAPPPPSEPQSSPVPTSAPPASVASPAPQAPPAANGGGNQLATAVT